MSGPAPTPPAPAAAGVDYGARDARIRHLTYTPLRRREGVPQALFDAYWRDVHGPLCARLPGLAFYVQHHVDRDRGADLWPLPAGVRPLGAVLDGLVEIGFADEAGQALFEAASPLLFADERNFIGHDVAYALPEGSRTLVDRDPDPAPNRVEPGHRLHLHLHGAGTAAFRGWAEGFAAALAAEPAVVKVRLHLPEPYHNGAPAPAAPEVDHALPRERKRVAIVEVGFASRLDAAAYLAGEAYRRQAEGLREHVSDLGAFLVSRQCVFIRDGVLTTAGLRGSRAAELIAALGALNQTQPAVTRLFRPG